MGKSHKEITRRAFLTLGLGLAGGVAAGCASSIIPTPESPTTPEEPDPTLPYTASPLAPEDWNAAPVEKSEDEWKALMPPLQYRVMRQQGTERAFTGRYHGHKSEGRYHCAACGTPLFGSEAKFDSGTGWPSFWAPLSERYIGTEMDRRLGMVRTEVHCARCGSHLGHVFEDGPEPTGLRYCINSIALNFVSADGESVEPEAGLERRGYDEKRT